MEVKIDMNLFFITTGIIHHDPLTEELPSRGPAVIVYSDELLPCHLGVGDGNKSSLREQEY